RLIPLRQKSGAIWCWKCWTTGRSVLTKELPSVTSIINFTQAMPVVAKGLEGIVAAETRIGDVRGQEGVLLYSGYDINELAGKASFEEVVFLLYHRRLPTPSELADLTATLRAERSLPQGVIDYLLSAP